MMHTPPTIISTAFLGSRTSSNGPTHQSVGFDALTPLWVSWVSLCRKLGLPRVDRHRLVYTDGMEPRNTPTSTKK